MARDRLLAEVLYQDERHVCLCFHELMPRETMPSNQCMIIHRGHAAILDPGGDLNFNPCLSNDPYVSVKSGHFVALFLLTH